jgi:hypothetical protein
MDNPVSLNGLLQSLINHYGRNILAQQQGDQLPPGAAAEMADLLKLKGQGIGLGTGDPGLRRGYDYPVVASQQGWSKF